MEPIAVLSKATYGFTFVPCGFGTKVQNSFSSTPLAQPTTFAEAPSVARWHLRIVNPLARVRQIANHHEALCAQRIHSIVTETSETRRSTTFPAIAMLG